MAGKPSQGAAGGQGKRPAISIDANFDEPSRGRGQAGKPSPGRTGGRSDALPSTRSNVIVYSIIAIVIGLPIVAIIWLVVMPESGEDRYPKAKVVEARKEMMLMATKAQLIYNSDPNRIPKSPTPQDLGMTASDLGGDFDVKYQMLYDPQAGVLTIFAQSIFGDPPTELVLSVNLRASTTSFNRP